VIGLEKSLGWKRAIAALIIVSIFAPLAWFGLVASDPHFAWVMQDDAFYYSVTARNFVELGWATFDTLNPTNGFHPLYFLLVSGISTSVAPEFYLNAIYLLHIALLLIAFGKLVQIIGVAPVWVIVLFLPFIASDSWLQNVLGNPGMESTLAFAAAIYFYDAFRQAAQSGFSAPIRNLAFGVAATALMLSRLDTVVLVMPTAIAAAAWSISVTSVRRIPSVWISLFAIPLVFCSIYLAINLTTTGHMTPVSGAVKWAFRMPWEVSLRTITHGYSPPFVAAFLLPPLMAAIAVVAGVMNLRNGKFDWGTTLLLAALGIGLYYLYLRFGASNAFNWYLGAVTGVATWIFATLIARIRWPRLPVTPAMVLCVFGLLIVVYEFKDTLNGTTSIIDRVNDRGQIHKLSGLGLFLGEIAEPGDIAATFDAGKIGYFSSIPVINLDGLANSYRYLEDVRSTGRFKEYFDDIGVSYFLARDAVLSEIDAVRDGTYEMTTFALDPRLVFRSTDEVHRVVVDEGFLVIVFRYPPAPMD
jgi:hypothetical protein